MLNTFFVKRTGLVFYPLGNPGRQHQIASIEETPRLWRLLLGHSPDVPGEYKVDDVVCAREVVVQVSCRCVVGDKQVA
jgi:hypothetical protein